MMIVQWDAGRDEAQRVMEEVRRIRRTETDSLGFIPFSGVQRLMREGKLLVAFHEQTVLGYALLGGGKDVARVFQLCVDRRYRLLGVGRALLELAEEWARTRGRRRIIAKVATDLRAVAFWDHLGWNRQRIDPGGARRGRRIIVFERDLR